MDEPWVSGYAGAGRVVLVQVLYPTRLQWRSRATLWVLLAALLPAPAQAATNFFAEHFLSATSTQFFEFTYASAACSGLALNDFAANSPTTHGAHYHHTTPLPISFTLHLPASSYTTRARAPVCRSMNFAWKRCGPLAIDGLLRTC